MNNFLVKTGSFEGPLELLLELIENRKLHISDISLAAVTDDFIAYVKNLGQFRIESIAHFILIASTLLLIKSKSLLPGLKLTEEEQIDIHILEERLRLYQKIKELSRHIKERFGKKIIFARSDRRIIKPVFSPDRGITLNNILDSVRQVLKSIPIKEFIPETIVKRVVSLEEMVARLVKRIEQNIKLSFREFSKNSSEKIEIIVGFLAILELFKKGVIHLTQDKQFEDISIEHNNVKVLKYSG